MEATANPIPSPGGSVEPLDRGLVAKTAVRAGELATERFELHDPRADLTYRMKSFVEMVTKANRIGALRFTAIGPDGTRSTVSKVGGVWRRDDRTPFLPVSARQAVTAEAMIAPPNSPTNRTEPADSRNGAEAERTLRRLRIEAALHERYVIKRAPFQIGDLTIGQTEYRHRGDASKVAFTETNFRLSTDNNNPSVARSMVDVAEARGWQALRVSGNDDFKRVVWLEASLRDVKTIGHEATQGDLGLLRKEREARNVNRLEPMTPPPAPSAPAKQSERGSGGRKSVLAALEAVLIAKHVPERQREAVMVAAAENLAVRLKNGETHRVKVYDKAAPVQRTTVAPTRDIQRDRDRGPRARS